MFKRLYYILLQRFYLLSQKNKPCQGKVYMFHNVNEDHDTYAITKQHFESFIDHLVKNKKIVDIRTLIEQKDPNNVVISFDDVHDSVFYNAYPLLKEKGLPFYLFVSNEYLNTKGYLNEAMISEMLKDSGAVLGSHHYRHALSRFMDDKELKEDLLRSKEELEGKFNVEIDSFAFPFGSMYACSKQNIKDAAEIFDYVFMTYAIPYHESYGKVLPRINMNDSSYEREMK